MACIKRSNIIYNQRISLSLHTEAK